MIPTNKLKKLVIECIVKFMDDSFQNIWDNCSKEILETTENQINPLQIKELFFKEILPDLSYNNFGYDSETVAKLKNFKTNIDNDRTSSIDWTEVDKVIAESVKNEAKNLAEFPEEQIISTDDEYEGDESINAILAKYSIPGHVRASQGPLLTQESEQMYCFRESQLLNIFDGTENDPLTNNISNTENPIKSTDYDAYDNLRDEGKMPKVTSEFSAETFKCSETPYNSISLDNTHHRRKSLKRKSSSLSDLNLVNDQDYAELSMPKRKFSSSLQGHSLMSGSSIIELGSITQQIDDDLHATNKEFEAELESEELNNSTSIDNAFDRKIDENSKNIVEKSTDEIVAEIQTKLFAATNNEEIQRILDDHHEYLLMLEIPFIMPEDCSNDDKSENLKKEKSQNSKSIKESQNVNSTQQSHATKPARKKIPRDLKYCRPNFFYENTQCSDTINPEETSNWLTMNDTVLSGSHKDCIGTVKDLDWISSSQLSTSRPQSHSNSHPPLPENILTDPQATEEEIIEKIQKQLDAAEAPEEVDRILNENDKYRFFVRIPFNPSWLDISQNSSEKTENLPEKHLPKEKINQEKSKEKIIEDIQKQLDAARDPDIINKILRENDEFLLFLTIPFILPPDFDDNDKKAQSDDDKLISKNSTSRVKQEIQKKRKQALKDKDDNNFPEKQNLERNESQTELSFLLGENVNLKQKATSSAPKPKNLDENVIIDLIDDDD